MTLGFKERDPARDGFQFIEDLSTAYWHSEVLFASLELELFGHLAAGNDRAETLADSAGCRLTELARLLTALAEIGLVTRVGDRYYNSQLAALYLVPGTSGYMGQFFLYRKYMRPGWETLTSRVALRPPAEKAEPSYEEKNFQYVAAMDTLVRQKAREIAAIVAREKISGPLLDVGGGAGSLLRAVRAEAGPMPAVLFDIPEVIGAAQRICPDPEDWEGISTVAGDFRTHEFREPVGGPFGTIFLSNFLHAYGPEEARVLFAKAAGLLAEDGLLVVHDYFPDAGAACKGALYDLAMMLNTYNGCCHTAATVMDWCREEGLGVSGVAPLSTDSAVILARREGSLSLALDPLEAFAAGLDLEGFVPIRPADVVTAAWPREKCRTGCALYNKGLQCPPYGMDHEKTRRLLSEYERAYLVRGTPPGKDFHNTLLALEKKAFLEGFHKAFSLGAGPCTVCPACPADGRCRFPHLARPSMEGSGIDVYTTAAKAGIHLKPVQQKGRYVTYIGLLLVE